MSDPAVDPGRRADRSRLLGAVAVIMMVAYGVQYSFGLFYSAILAESRGWSRAGLAAVFSLYSTIYAVGGWPSGWLSDRFGARSVMAIGGGILCLGLVLASQARAPWHMFLAYGVVAAVGMSTVYVPGCAAVVRQFGGQRGRALTLIMAALGMGLLLVPPILEKAIEANGWRVALAGAGVVMTLCVCSLALLLGSPSPALPAEGRSRAQGQMPVRRALARPTIYLLCTANLLVAYAASAVLVHLPQHTLDLGIDWPRSSLLVTLGSTVVIGNLLVGAVVDDLDVARVLQGVLVLGTLSLVLLATGGNLTLQLVAASGFGLLYGLFYSLFPALVADRFGEENAGSLLGLSFAISSVGSALGPALSGWVADWTGGYALAFGLAAAATAGAVLSLVSLEGGNTAVGGRSHPAGRTD